MTFFKFQDEQLRKAQLWTCSDLDYANVNALTRIGKYTLERQEEDSNGDAVTFKRGCYWLLSFEWGSYNLRKIMHQDGTAIEPAYSEYLMYRQGLVEQGKNGDLILWKGLKQQNIDGKDDSAAAKRAERVRSKTPVRSRARVTSMRVPELKSELRQRGLSRTGNKAVLQQRLLDKVRS